MWLMESTQFSSTAEDDGKHIKLYYKERKAPGLGEEKKTRRRGAWPMEEEDNRWRPRNQGRREEWRQQVKTKRLGRNKIQGQPSWREESPRMNSMEWAVSEEAVVTPYAGLGLAARGQRRGTVEAQRRRAKRR